MLAAPVARGQDAPASPAPTDSTASAPGAAPTPAEPTLIAAGGSSDPSLAASTAAPWQPAQPVPAARSWETALRFPGRIISLPLSAVGLGVDATVETIERTNLLGQLRNIAVLQQRAGVGITTASLGDRASWGAGVRWALPYFDRHLVLDVAGSVGGYNRERAVFLLGPLRAQYLSEWRSKEGYFGPGLESSRDNFSTFAQRIENVELGLGWAWRPADTTWLQSAFDRNRFYAPLPPRTSFSVWAGPRTVFVTNGRDEKYPSFHELFPEDSVNSLRQRVENMVYGVRLSNDERLGRPHWSRGWRGTIEAQRFGKSIEALALRDAHTDAVSFTRLSYLLEGAVSYGVDPRTFRLTLTAVDQILDSGPGRFQMNDYVRLGGNVGLAGFEPGRFSGIDMALGKLSYIFPLSKNLEMDLHAEAGGVYENLKDARVETIKKSYGALLRVRSSYAVFGYVGFDWSEEQTRFRFTIGAIE